MHHPPVEADSALRGLWAEAGLDSAALACADLVGGRDPVLPSSFAVGLAAQSSMAAAALAACEVGHLRGQPRQRVTVDLTHAALECLSWFTLDGVAPDVWEKFSGLSPTSDGHVRIHANFAHHRDGALGLLGLKAEQAEKADVERALSRWCAIDFEQAAADAGLPVTALRTFDQWDATPAAHALAMQPLLHIERIGDAPPLPLPPLADDQWPLAGVRVLDLTRILAGPVGTRGLAGYGAQVMLVNAPHLPNIAALAETSRGKLSALLDLRTPGGRESLQKLLQSSHVMVQGYRPGALARLGLGAHDVAALRPGIVVVSLSAYGPSGPWAGRRGFDSLVQTATGFNHAEGQAYAAHTGQPWAPRALPMQVLDHASGWLMALGAAAALACQQREGGSWHVQVSLARTGLWLRGLGRVAAGFAGSKPTPQPFLQTESTEFGILQSVRHAVQLARTPVRFDHTARRPGSDAPRWP